MGGIKTQEILVVDSNNLFDQRVLTVPVEVARLLQRDERTGDLRWIGPVDKEGYGVIRRKALLDWLKERNLLRSGAHSVQAHVFTYLCYYGAIRPGWTVDHREITCPLRHKRCCWPLHLEAVPNAVNIKRGNQANYHPVEQVPRAFDAQWFDAHVLPNEQRTVLFFPAERPLYRASRWDKQHGLDHEAIQATFV